MKKELIVVLLKNKEQIIQCFQGRKTADTANNL